MPTVKDFGSFRIYMYYEDENPPHVHIVAADYEAKMRIADQVIFKGEAPGKVERKAAEYVRGNKRRLQLLWKQYSG